MNKIIENELIRNAKVFLKDKNTFKESAYEYFKAHGLPLKSSSEISPRFVQTSEDNISTRNDLALDPRGIIAFRNGVFDPKASCLPKGISIIEANANENFIDSFDALNALASIAPISLKVEKNIIIDFPITILHSLSEASVNKIISPRIDFTLEENSQISLLEIFSFFSVEQYTTNAFTSFNLGKNAQVEHVKLGTEAKSSVHLGWTTADLSRDSRFYSTVLNTGNEHSNHQLKINLNDSGAETSAYALFNLKGSQETTIHTSINHNSSHTSSTQLCKGILSDESFGIFDGNILVSPGVENVTSSQLNKNLLLSKKAHIKTQPQLLVDSFDVKCAHGATVGQLSEEEAFYLESRGIDKTKAQEILMRGFLSEILFHIKDQAIRKYCERKILQ